MSKMRPPKPPHKLTGADYEWDGRETYSRYWSDDGSAMAYVGRWRKGRFVVSFEGAHIGPVGGYKSEATASQALARMENGMRETLYQERLQKWSERRTLKELKARGLAK